MRFKRFLIFLIFSVYICFGAVGQVRNMDSDLYSTASQSAIAEGALLLSSTQELTAEEERLILESATGQATQVEQMSAKTVCEEKCPSCFDGIECDLKCAEKHCLSQKQMQQMEW